MTSRTSPGAYAATQHNFHLTINPVLAGAVLVGGTLPRESGLDAKCLLHLAQKPPEIDPDNPDLRQALVATLYRTGPYQKAKETLAIFSADKETSWTRFFLALACQRQGKTDRAREWLDALPNIEAAPIWMDRVVITTLRALFESLGGR